MRTPAVTASDGIDTTSRTVAWTIVQPGALVWDSFTGTNGTSLTSHAPEIVPSGVTWQQLGGNGNATITNGQTVSSGTGYQAWTLNVGVADATIAVDVRSTDVSPYGGLVFRAADASNYLMLRFDGPYLYRRQGGTFIYLGGIDPPYSMAGGQPHRLKVVLQGSLIQVHWDGVFQFEVTETFQQTLTRHGLMFNPTEDSTAVLDNLEIFGPNLTPTVTGPPNQTHFVGLSISVPITATDPENQPLTYSATGLPSGLSVNATSGVITGTITAAPGVYAVNVAASDGLSTRTRALSWTVTSTNSAPVVTAPSNQVHPAGALVSVAIVASDVENQPLSYSATGLPAGLGVNATTGFISGTILTSNSGDYPVVVSVSDGSATTQRSFTWTVLSSAANVIVQDTFTATNGTPLASHAPDVAPSGQSWQQMGGNGSVILNDGDASSTGTGYQVWTVNSGVADGAIAVDVSSTDGSPYGGLVFRAVDADNYFMLRFNGPYLYRRQNGVFFYLGGTDPPNSMANGQPHRLKVLLEGSLIRVYWDGVWQFEVNDTTWQTGTRHGLMFNPTEDTTALLDNFEITTGPGAPVVTGPVNHTHLVGSTVSVPITATNPQNQSLTYNATGLPAGVTLNTTTGVISGTLSASPGSYTVGITVSDGWTMTPHAFTWTILAPPPSPPPLARVFDSFTSNGPKGALTAHTPDVAPQGASWLLLEGPGTPTVDAGVTNASGSGGYGTAVIESGTANGIVAVDFRSTAASPQGGIALRVANASNLLLLRYTGAFGVGRLELLRRVNGFFSVITSAPVGAIVPGSTHRIEARLNGPSITGLWDGVHLFETTVNDNQNSTLHGLLWNGSSDATAAFDNFKITTESFSPVLPAGTVCEPILSQWVISLGPENSTPTINVTLPPSCVWTARMITGDFVQLNGTFPQSGSAPAQFNVANNTDTVPRVAYANVAGRLVSIDQPGVNGSCSYAVSAGDLDFGSEGGAVTLTVTPSHPTCTWTATSEQNWIGITVGALRTGQDTFVVNVPGNSGPTRNGFISVGTSEVPVEQNGDVGSGNPACIYTTSSFTAPAGGGAGFFDISVPSGCSWSATSNSSFVHLTGQTTGSGAGTLTFTVDPNPDPQWRVGIVNIQGADWTVIQFGSGAAAPGCDFSLTVSSDSPDDGVLHLKVADGCTWSVTPQDTSVILDINAGTGSMPIGFHVDRSQLPQPSAGALSTFSQPMGFSSSLSCTLIPIPCIDSNRCTITRWCFNPFPAPAPQLDTPALLRNPIGPIQRGETVGFYLVGLGERRVLSWKFQGDNVGTILRQTNVRSGTWRGVLVDSGTVTVEYTGAGSPVSLQVTVYERNSFTTPTAQAERVENRSPDDKCPLGTLTLPVPVVNQAGALAISCLEPYGRVDTEAVGTNPAERGGPNEGVKWIPRITVGDVLRWRFRWVINPDLDDVNCAFYLQQTGTYHPVNNPKGWISGETLRSVAIRHESDQFQNSHFSKYLAANQATNVGDEIEGLLEKPTTPLSAWNQLVSDAITDAQQQVINATKVEPYDPERDPSSPGFQGFENYAPYGPGCHP